MKTPNVSTRSLTKLNELKNRKNKYTVFRAYNKYWLVDSSLIENNSVDLFDIDNYIYNLKLLSSSSAIGLCAE